MLSRRERFPKRKLSLMMVTKQKNHLYSERKKGMNDVVMTIITSGIIVIIDKICMRDIDSNNK